MRMISRTCGTNSRRRSRLVAHPRQSVVFSLSTCIADGDSRLQHQALLVEIRHRALNQVSFAARYDVATSLRIPWSAPSVSKVPSDSRLNTFPSSRPNSVPLPQSPRVACGSPCDKTEISLLFPDHGPDCDHDSDDAITLVPSLRQSTVTRAVVRIIIFEEEHRTYTRAFREAYATDIAVR
jgi:hypothetical protein